jgi:hypothetical protein
VDPFVLLQIMHAFVRQPRALARLLSPGVVDRLDRAPAMREHVFVVFATHAVDHRRGERGALIGTKATIFAESGRNQPCRGWPFPDAVAKKFFCRTSSRSEQYLRLRLPFFDSDSSLADHADDGPR